MVRWIYRDLCSTLHLTLSLHALKDLSSKITCKGSAYLLIEIEWLLASYFPVKYASAYHNAMADVPGGRSKESLLPSSPLRDSSPPKTVRRRSSKRDREEANRDGDPDENPPSFFVITPPPEPAPRIPRLTPQEPGFINGADYILFADSEDEYDPDASIKPNPKKRRLEAREREDRRATKEERSDDRAGRDHVDTPWMRHLRVDPSASVSTM